MKEFLNDYVQMIAESMEIRLSQSQMESIVNSLQENESLWDMFDSHVNYAIAKEMN